MVTKVIVCLFAGVLAGLGVGFAGMSAATVIAPILVVFLNMTAYQSVGVALAADVLAAACTAGNYARHRHIDIKNGLVMLGTVLVFTLIGSGAAYLVSRAADEALGYFSVFMALALGLSFLFRSEKKTSQRERRELSPKRRTVESLVCGCYIGFVCGFMGAGGGLMLLFVLTSVLGYELKTAVGTSTFIMTFTALAGALSRFVTTGVQDWTVLLLCTVFTLLAAQWASHFANHADNRTVNRATGIVLTVLGVVLLVVKVFFQ